MKRLFLSFVLVTLAACTTFGIDPPATFNQRAAAAQIATTTARTTATTLLTAQKISADNARDIQGVADAASASIALSLQIHNAACPPTASPSCSSADADNRLASAIALVSGVQQFLNAKGAK